MPKSKKETKSKKSSKPKKTKNGESGGKDVEPGPAQEFLPLMFMNVLVENTGGSSVFIRSQDLRVPCEMFEIKPGEKRFIPTHWELKTHDGSEGQLRLYSQK